MEADGNSGEDEVLSEILTEFLDELKALTGRPPEMSPWNDAWGQAHSLFVYEVFLYSIAALLKARRYLVLRHIYSTRYVRPSNNHGNDSPLERFDSFQVYSECLQSVLAPEGKRLHSPAAEVLHRQADRQDMPFAEIIQADLLTMLMGLLTPDAHWHPQTVYYSSYNANYPLFLRAAERRHFSRIAIVTGISDVDELRARIAEGLEQITKSTLHHPGWLLRGGYRSLLNVDKWHTL